MNNPLEGISTHKELTIVDRIMEDRRWQFGLLGLALVMTFAVLMALAYWLRQPVPVRPGIITGVISWEMPAVGRQAVYALPVKVWNYLGLALEGDGITDAAGNFKVVNLPPGKYVVSAYQPQTAEDGQTAPKCWVVKNVEVSSNRSTQVILEMRNALAPEDFSKFTRQCQ